MATALGREPDWYGAFAPQGTSTATRGIKAHFGQENIVEWELAHGLHSNLACRPVGWQAPAHTLSDARMFPPSPHQGQVIGSGKEKVGPLGVLWDIQWQCLGGRIWQTGRAQPVKIDTNHRARTRS